MQEQELKSFTESDNKTWGSLYLNLRDNRIHQADPMFAEGLKLLGIDGNEIPDLKVINSKLKNITGWQAVPVKGLESGESFFRGLSEKKFPIGNFIRESKDLSYTPEPDIFHDLYGHIPFFADKKYADFNEEFGKMATKYINDPQKLLKFERLYWFGLEFPLIDYPQGRRIFGAGLLSSVSESNYSLSDKPKICVFDLNKIANQEFRIDIFQEILFVLNNKQQLYTCLPEFEKIIN